MSKPQVVYGATVIRTEVLAFDGRSVRPLRGADGQAIVLTAAVEGEPPAEFWAELGESLEQERLRLEEQLRAKDPAGDG